jgi:transcriptional regulator with XRE-family HTH domain
MTSQRSWEQKGYGDVVKARRRDELLEVTFANGDVVLLEPGPLGLAWEFEAEPAEGGAAILIKTPEGEHEVDWMVVRSASDPDFARELRERDAEEAHRIGRRLRALRENRGITQKDAAAKADMSSPQLAKLERGATDMRISTLRGILRALNASFADVAGPDAPEVSLKALGKEAERFGVPREIVGRLGAALGPQHLADLLGRVFGWDPQDVAKGVLSSVPEAHAVLKRRSTTGDSSAGMILLAESLARRAALAYRERPGHVPNDPKQIRDTMDAGNGSVTLEPLLRWCWENGVVVVPMAAKGGLSAAAWMIGDQPVVVIKESPDYQAYWLFALAHELGHLGLGHVVNDGVVDIGSATEVSDDEQEQQANEFALDLLVPDHVSMLQEIRRRSEGLDAPKKFKWRAIDAAKARSYDESLVLLVAAFGLPDVARPGDRWGSANKRAEQDGSGRSVVIGQFARHVDLDQLDRLDSALVKEFALSDGAT